MGTSEHEWARVGTIGHELARVFKSHPYQRAFSYLALHRPTIFSREKVALLHRPRSESDFFKYTGSNNDNTFKQDYEQSKPNHSLKLPVHNKHI